MKMNIKLTLTTGMICLTAVLGSSGILKAQESKPFVDMDFNDQVPGMNCDAIKRSWGKQNEDLILIDNVQTYNGDGNCMLFERSKKNSHWGVGLNLPQEKYDWLKIQLVFKFDGAATKATSGLELREHYNKRLYHASLGSSKGKDPITLIDGGSGWKTSKVNHFDRSLWNRVTWFVPSVTANDMTLYLKLESWDVKTKQWQQVDQIGSMPASKVEKPFALFRINFPSSEDSLKLRYDDLKIEPVSNDQISALIQ
ncbi:MAG: hypothetical protein ACF8OB_00185 [Phycisphaeraceae bacterium JB051]